MIQIPTDRPLRLVVPIRTSKRKKGAQGPRQQRDTALACARAHGYEVVEVLDSGRSESGKTMRRETILTAMTMVRSGEADGILLPAVDRFGRAPIEEMMSVARELGRVGVLVPADAGGVPLDLDDPATETNLVIQFQMARQYWSTRAVAALTTRRNAVAEGKYVAGAPKGFDKRAGRLQPNDDAGFMRGVFAAAATGSLHGAQALLRGRWPRERWDVDRVRKLLRSPAYKGWSVSGELVNRQAHDAIVTDSEWQRAQSAPRARRRNGRYPLSGIAVCDGEPLVGQLQTVRGKAYRRMRTATTATCSISASALENEILGQLKLELDSVGFRQRFMPGDVEAARRELAFAEAEKTAYVTSPGVSALDAETFEAGLAARLARERAARVALTELDARATVCELLPSADDLDFERDEHGHPIDAEGFELALRLAVDSVIVRPGRGPVAQRVVDIVWTR